MMFVFTKYSWLGASSRVRFFKYLSLGFLSEKKIKVNTLFNDNYIKNLYSRKNKSITDLFVRYFIRLIFFFYSLFNIRVKKIWIEKELFPHIPIPFEVLFKLFRKKVIYDFDDAVFHNYDKSRLNFLFKFKFRMMMKYSDLVFVGNEYLFEQLSSMGAKNIKIIPTVIDLASYKEALINYDKNFNQKVNSITIGWIGTPTTQKYLSLVDDAIHTLQSELSIDIKFNIIGANKDISLISDFEIIQWSEDTEIDNLLSIDIGIMPLFDSSFERGKCGYKLIQYFACKKPVLASPIGVNKSIVINGVNGFLCYTKDDWYNYLKVLILDENLRHFLANNGFKLVEEYYCYQVQYLNILEEMEQLK